MSLNVVLNPGLPVYLYIVKVLWQFLHVRNRLIKMQHVLMGMLKLGQLRLMSVSQYLDILFWLLTDLVTEKPLLWLRQTDTQNLMFAVSFPTIKLHSGCSGHTFWAETIGKLIVKID